MFEDDFKTEGWTANDLLPLMKRLENYQKPVNNDTHGYDGPIAISNGGQITPLAWDFLRASDAIGVPYSGMCACLLDHSHSDSCNL